jgi:hypothetical protein
MLSLTPLRTLDLASPPSPGRAAHISAASGLVSAGAFLYVIADDELHLGVFPASGDGPGLLIRLFEGQLPEERPARKASKPDVETLLLLPPMAAYAHGALLALGSGSTRNRFRGAVLPLADDGAVGGPPNEFDLTTLYAPLTATFPSLNIEGGFVSGNTLALLQRGNKAHPLNALIRFDLAAALAAIAGGAVPPPRVVSRLHLGVLDGIPLAVTDAAALQHGAAGLPEGSFVFTAAAEDTDDPYRDGPLAGAAIGIARPDGQVLKLMPVEPRVKVEGITAQVEGRVVQLLLVDDPDNPDIAARLYSATLPL